MLLLSVTSYLETNGKVPHGREEQLCLVQDTITLNLHLIHSHDNIQQITSMSDKQIHENYAFLKYGAGLGSPYLQCMCALYNGAP